ncbi:MAG: hypothetical protein CVV47_05965 [Spirochaetae bacterium HGW-Spirochaetae-3]|jgi:chromosome segregation ATPase|nr:MAG: hypothetical protein CVV47_05965 [Spirochaetae bacterium HGW-Spirochaetae-3]
MISLEQVRALESRVEKAVTLIASLRAENASMRSGLAAAETRVAELEGLVADFQKDQARIEESIVEALHKLDSFEDAVHEASTKPLPPPVKPEAPVKKPDAIEPVAQEEDLAALEEQTRPDEPSDALDIF